MEVVADQLDNVAYPTITDAYPFSTDDIREFVETERRFLLALDPAELSQPFIQNLDVVERTAKSITLRWLAEPDTRYRVEITQQLPDYGPNFVPDMRGLELSSTAEFTIPGLTPDSPYWVRIVAMTDDETVTSGDFPVWTHKLGEEDPSPAPEAAAKPSSGGGSFSLLSLLGLWMLLLLRRQRSLTVER